MRERGRFERERERDRKKERRRAREKEKENEAAWGGERRYSCKTARGIVKMS